MKSVDRQLSRNVALFFGVWMFWVSGCSGGQDSVPVSSPTVVSSERSAGAGLPEGSKSSRPAESEPLFSEGSGSQAAVPHPEVAAGEKVDRKVLVPEDVENKWKAVKLLVKDKTDEENNSMKTVPLGSSFTLGEGRLKVTVGPFFPNFVMAKDSYSSMNNETINPAVQLVIEEDDKIIYKGWAFARFPTLYAFQHEVYALELKDYIPTGVS